MRYLNDRVNVEKARPARLDPSTFKLDRMRAMLDVLGNPQRDFRSVHVAGSKGKGSVTEMTAACLRGCGLTVGVYTSPHLISVLERIRINESAVSQAEFTRLVARVAAAADRSGPAHGDATFFEIVTAAAFVYFADQAVDLAVVEVGLGGRLDSTNVIQPEVAAVTAIQLEHTQLLGATPELIAAEKAGIYKAGAAALTIPQEPGVLAVLRDAAARVGAEFAVVGHDIDFSYRIEASPELGPHARVCLTTPRSTFEHLPVPLKGEHQARNCGLALAIVDRLSGRGFDTPARRVAEGLARTRADGRLEQVWASPRIFIDGAHNPESIQSLVRSLGSHLRYDSLVVVFGCADDKNIDGMLAKLATGADKVIFTRASGSPRSADPKELQRRFTELCGKMSQVAPGVPAAVTLAARAVSRDDLICVTGSFYVAGEAKAHLQEQASPRRSAKG